MNAIPSEPGQVLQAPSPSTTLPDNTLSEREKADGWQLLFDGQSISQFHRWGKEGVGSSWIIKDNALHLDAQPNPEGHWQTKDGGDILTNEEFQDFELSIEWKIAPCGNSGIIYNVLEDPAKYNYVWQTGPEMQVLDNTCHPDGRIIKHRAGDLYDLITCKYETVKPAGQCNKARIVSKNGKVEHWLNDRKLVEVQMFNNNWNTMIANSKFKDMPGFGRYKKGKIALQDHGDPVWFKNIKIRKL
jgi:cytochrome c